MRVYYIFSVKDYIKNLYLDNQNNLFLILRNIYFMRECDKEYALNLYKQLINPLDKAYINKDIFIKYHNTYMYSKQDNKHIMNNLYKDEVSIMTVKNSYILLNTNNNNSSFFKVLDNYSHNLFICDFENYDYFFLDSIKNLA